MPKFQRVHDNKPSPIIDEFGYEFFVDQAKIYICNFITSKTAMLHLGKDSLGESIANLLGLDKLYNDFKNEKITYNDYVNQVVDFCNKERESMQSKDFKKQMQSYKFYKNLEKNLSYLQAMLNLNEIELAIIRFVVITENFATLFNFMQSLRTDIKRHLAIVLSQMLDCPFNGVAIALQKKSTLSQAGIIEDNGNVSVFRDWNINFANTRFADMLISEYDDNNDLISSFVELCPKSNLTKDNYPYIKDFDLMVQYLSKAIENHKIGANILLYGDAGMGKTELAKLLAKSIGVQLYKIKSDYNDAVLDSKDRLNLYLLAQKFINPTQNILLYDEVEDILNSSVQDKRLQNKAFLNEILETNTVPTIWIINNISLLDNASIRRFDCVMEIVVKDKEHKEQILRHICGKNLDAKTIDFALNIKRFAPAIFHKANEVSMMMGGDFAYNFTTLIKNTIKAQKTTLHLLPKRKKSKKPHKSDLPKSYSLEFINVDCDLNAIIKALKNDSNIKICIYGISGTGKSAFAQYLAKELQKDCIIQNASDLLNMFVGGTEQNIAKAFKNAKKRENVLVFDEVDSFLRDRSAAMRNFEISQTNEMLTQMEKFNGVFVATTNLMSDIDKAALRRFDLKLEFKALNDEQKAKLLERECALLGLKCNASVKKHIKHVENLTLGDFAVVVKQHRFNPIKDADDFYERLCNEVKVKNISKSAKVGFLD